MSERILKALMQLFAIIAEVDIQGGISEKEFKERKLVELFFESRA